MDKAMVERVLNKVCEEIGPVATCNNPIGYARMVVERIDAERGKGAVGTVGELFDDYVLAKSGLDKDRLVFFSPATPEGMALVPIEIINKRPLNTGHYGHDDVSALHAWSIELAIAAAQREHHE